MVALASPDQMTSEAFYSPQAICFPPAVGEDYTAFKVFLKFILNNITTTDLKQI